MQIALSFDAIRKKHLDIILDPPLLQYTSFTLIK